jgi:chromosome segregation ATPase
MKIETIKKSQRETTLEIENLGKRLGSIINRIQEMEDRISSAEDTIENTDTKSKKMQNTKVPNPKHPGKPGHNEKTKPNDNRYRRD